MNNVMLRIKRAGVAVAMLLSFLTAGHAAAEWGELSNEGLPVVDGIEPVVTYMTDETAIMPVCILDGSSWRVHAYQYKDGSWSPLAGGMPVDEGLDVNHRSVSFVQDGAGHAMLVYSRLVDYTWRLYARWFTGASFNDLNDGNPIDRGFSGNAFGCSVAHLGGGKFIVVFTQKNETRSALYGIEYASGAWAFLNGGEPLDDAALGWSDCPAIAPDSNGGAIVAYTQQKDGLARVFALKYDGVFWTRFNGGLPLDSDDLGNSTGVKMATASNGFTTVAYMQEDVDYIMRLYGKTWNGLSWRPINDGNPLDTAVKGVGALSAVADGPGKCLVAYATLDQVDYVEPAKLYCLIVEDTRSVFVNDGEELQAGVAYKMEGVDVGRSGRGDSVLVFGQYGGSSEGVFARKGDFSIPENVAAAGNAGMRAVHNVFKPGNGESVRVVCTVPQPQRVKLALYTLRGTLVKVLADEVISGEASHLWDGRNGNSTSVAPGVYYLIADGETFRTSKKVVVLR